MKAVVLGIGADGMASKAILERDGAEVILADDATAPLSRLPPGVGLVVPRPGVKPSHPLLRAAHRRGIPIWSEIELAARVWRGRMLAITGTNGKGSVTTMVTDALRRAGYPARAVGNIGDPMGSAVLHEPKTTILVVEVSSAQLHYCESFAPDAAALLNVTVDHMDWHRSLREYKAAKANVFSAQPRDGWAVINAGDPGAWSLADRARGRVCLYHRRPPRRGGLGVVGGRVVADDDAPGGGGELLDLDAIGPRPPHQVDNAMAVLALVRAVDPQATGAAVAAITAFSGLPHMHQVAVIIDGVDYVDDSKATNPTAAAASITARSDVVLIAGGQGKGLSFAPMVEAARGRVRAVVLIGEAAPALAEAFAAVGIPVEVAEDMDQAVALAAEWAEPGSTVLLAPGCASRDMFTGQAARGDAFAAAALRLARVG